MTDEANGERTSPEQVRTRLLGRIARILHRVGFKNAAARLLAMETQRWIVSRYVGARDDEDNARTTPPEEEHITIYSLWMVEVFPPSQAGRLGEALRRLPSGGIYRDGDLAEEVARARRYPWGGSWWNLGLFVNQSTQQGRVGGSHLDLPPEVEYLHLGLRLITPSLACALGQFVLTEAAGAVFEETLRKHHGTRAERTSRGAVSIRRPAEVKRDLIANELDRLHDLCRTWYETHLPGAFCQGLLGRRVPTLLFLSLDKVRPLSDEARLGYLEPLGVDSEYAALTASELPGLRLSEATGVHRPPHTYVLAGKTDEIFPDDHDLGGHKRGREGFTVALSMRLEEFMAVWGLERTLLGYELAFGKVRDSFAVLGRRSMRQNLSALTVATDNVAKLSADAHAVAADAERLAIEDRKVFEKEIPSFEAVQPQFWRQGKRWNETFREGIEASAHRVRQQEATARDLEATTASLISSRTNLWLQRSLRRLTWFLLLLTIVLVLLGIATLDAMR